MIAALIAINLFSIFLFIIAMLALGDSVKECAELKKENKALNSQNTQLQIMVASKNMDEMI